MFIISRNEIIQTHNHHRRENGKDPKLDTCCKLQESQNKNSTYKTK